MLKNVSTIASICQIACELKSRYKKIVTALIIFIDFCSSDCQLNGQQSQATFLLHYEDQDVFIRKIGYRL